MPLRTFTAIALLAAACASPPPPDPVVLDPSPIDYAQPAALRELAFESAGERMNAIVYVAQGAGPHPTALLLHGLPGNERNLDLAQAMRRAGWNVVFFHYRGAWGSGGSFSFANALADVHAVLARLRDPEFAGAHRTDPERVALVGHSLGGFLALTAASEAPAVGCVASIAGANLGRVWHALPPERRAALAERLDASTGPLANTSGEALAREIAANADAWDPTRRAEALADRPLLLVAGARDDVTPIALAHDPLVAALREAGAERVTAVVLDADHAFSDHRLALTRALVEWLTAECR